MCDDLGLRFGTFTEDKKAMLKEQGKDKPTTAQLKKALDKFENEHQAILFLYKADKTRYGKYVKQLKNSMLEKKKAPFLKTVADVYGNRPKYTKANDGVAFAMTGTTEYTGIKTKKKERKVLCALNA